MHSCSYDDTIIILRCATWRPCAMCVRAVLVPVRVKKIKIIKKHR